MPFLSISRLCTISGRGGNYATQLRQQIYHIFRRYPAPQQFVVCCEYCLSQQEQKALRNTSLRAIPYSLINAWNSSPGPDPQNSDEVRYFLPRLLEFVAQGQFDNIHEV